MEAKLNDNITLQINLSPGDVDYAEMTVPALLMKHANIKNILIIADCCRPQKTKLLDPDVKFPMLEFNLKIDRLIGICNEFLANGLVTKVYFLKPNDSIIPLLSKKYLNNIYQSTHSSGGTANMSYWAGIELPETQYVLHYDGDMLLYQNPTYSWYDDAINHLKNNKDCLIAVPRLCPSLENNPNYPPSKHEGRPFTSENDFWKNDWFSTRVFLIDKVRLSNFLPLVRGKLMLELLVRKYFNRAFPLDPEIIMFKSIGGRNGKRLIMKNLNAWVLHPNSKDKNFIKHLPKILELVKVGKFPREQEGYEDIKLDDWIKYIKVNG
ncbi:hypothetical protein ABIB40_003583 [Pedobacter sp. UYP30]|uniref:hypothetical protein n=1 Tax=Pedobacter sp. UYP30 TaxID=1756400 RepID=UPI00339305BD